MRYRVFVVAACVLVGAVALSRAQSTQPSAGDRQQEIAQLKQQLKQIEARVAALEAADRAADGAAGKGTTQTVSNLKVPAASLPPGIRKRYVAKGSEGTNVYVDASLLPPGIAKKFHEDPNHPGYAVPLAKQEKNDEDEKD